MTISEVEKALKENANDFISRSIDAYNEDDNKMALMNLWSGILLLLKHWIFQNQPSMIYSKWEKIIQYKNYKLEFSPFISDGSYQTVDYFEIKERFKFLGNNSSLVFTYDKILENIRKKRNRIEHFVHDVNENEIISLFVEVLPFINDFIEQELNEKVNEYLDCWDEFLRINELYKHRLKNMEKYIKSISPTYRDIKHGDTELIEVDCPSCGDGKLINNEENILYCKACEYQTTFIQCNTCSQIILEDNFDTFLKETGMCSGCLDDICRRND